MLGRPVLISISMVILLIGASSIGAMLNASEIVKISQGYVSDAGYFEDSNSPTGQSPCPPGTWQNQTNQTFCFLANPGNIVNETVEMTSSVSFGYGHSCAIKNSGNLYCWSYNYHGQLGMGTNGGSTNQPSPVLVDFGESRVAKVSAGGGSESWYYLSMQGGPSMRAHTCAILDNGEAYCWGLNSRGQLGNGYAEYANNTPSPVILPNNSSAHEISTGYMHSCAIIDNGEVYCWGDNSRGQLGNGWEWPNNGNPDNSRYTSTPVKVSLPNNSVAISIGLGFYHTCALLDNESIYCWGYDSMGVLGSNVEPPYGRIYNPVIVSLPDEIGVESIDSGDRHNCALLNNGSVVCWGDNDRGQRGYDGWSREPNYVNFSNGEIVVDLSLGGESSCAILDDGSAYCWGNNNRGQLGLGTGTVITNYLPTPTQVVVPEDSTVTQISTSNGGSCIIIEDNSLRCSGIWTSDTGWYDDPNISIMIEGFRGSLPTFQTPCSPGTWQNQSGQTSCFDAEPGHYVDSQGAISQTACQPGSWQDEYKQTFCKLTEPGHFTDQVGATNQTPCEAPYFQHMVEQTSCFMVQDAHYVNSSAATQSTRCEPGTYQDEWGQTSCKIAEPGYFVPYELDPFDSNERYYPNAQIPCSPGSYQDQAGQLSCKLTNPGHFSEEGAIYETPCPPGSYQDQVGMGSCVVAGPGYYVPGYGQIEKIECGNGTYQDEYGQSSCKDSSPGHYVQYADGQFPCEPGTYQDEWRQMSCKDASPGHYVDSNASISQTLCPQGTYQESIGQISCIEADIGHYVPIEGSDYQIPCDWNKTTISTGNVLCIDDTDGDGIADILDIDDDGDLRDDIDDFCPSGDINWTSGAALGTDYDGDGCRDAGEDLDDDNDGINDSDDECPLGHTGWFSNPINDIDGDGCHESEDYDRDGDGFGDIEDAFPDDPTEWLDSDGDGVGDNADSGDTSDESNNILAIIAFLSLIVVVVIVWKMKSS